MDTESKIAQRPIFDEPISINFEKYDTKDVYTLISVDQSRVLSEPDIETITEICNQPLVYDFLFREKFKGRKYEYKDAEGFVKWAQEGWKNKTYFVFIIRNDKGEIVACSDIKSPNLDSAEIGYWASDKSSGVMTNAVKSLIGVAQKAGYKSLFGLVKPTNDKSSGVLNRNNFENVGLVTEDGEQYLKYFKEL